MFTLSRLRLKKQIGFALCSTILLLFFTSHVTAQQRSTILFQDNFDDGNADGWQHAGNGSWFVENNEYVVQMEPNIKLRSLSVAGDPSWSNFVYEVDIQGKEGVDKIIVARYGDEQNWYALNLRSTPFNDLTLSREEAGQHTILAAAVFNNDIGEWHHLTWAFYNNQIIANVDEQPLIAYLETGSTLVNGRVGLAGWTGSWGVDRVVFDNVVVSEYAGPTDVTLTEMGGSVNWPWLPFAVIGLLCLLIIGLRVWYRQSHVKFGSVLQIEPISKISRLPMRPTSYRTYFSGE